MKMLKCKICGTEKYMFEFYLLDRSICRTCAQDKFQILEQRGGKEYLLEEIARLETCNKAFFELIKGLMHGANRTQELQEESFKFLDDDVKMANHFRLAFGTVQGQENRNSYIRIAAFVANHGFDAIAAKEGLREVEKRLAEYCGWEEEKEDV